VTSSPPAEKNFFKHVVLAGVRVSVAEQTRASLFAGLVLRKDIKANMQADRAMRLFHADAARYISHGHITYCSYPGCHIFELCDD
jgi:hypothetical protein